MTSSALLLLILLGWMDFSQAQIEGESGSLGCFSDDVASPEWVVSAGGYDPSLLNPSACSSACQTDNYQYAGIQQGNHCLCSNNIQNLSPLDTSKCSSTCTGNSTGSNGWCGGPNGITSVYKAQVGVSFTGVKLSVSSATVQINQEVTFSVTLESGSNVQYRMNYGDGVVETLANVTGIFNHRYTVPGQYHPTLLASDAYNPQKSISRSVTIEVKQKMSGVMVDCPTMESPNQTFKCNISMITGPTATMTVDQGDGTIASTYTVTETRYDPVGTTVPQVEVMSTHNESLAPVVMLAGPEMDTQGYIVAVEAYITHLGSLDLLVLKPSCSSGQFCYGSRQCVSTCPSGLPQVSCQSPDVYHPSTGSCSTSFSAYKAQTSFTQRTTYNIPLSTIGYVYVDLQALSNVITVYPGDVLAFQTGGGAVVAYKDAPTARMTDQISQSVDGQWTNTTVRHYFRAIVTKPSVITLQLSYDATNNYTYDVTCVDGDGGSVTNRTTIMIVQGIAGVTVVASQSQIASKWAVTLTATVFNGSGYDLDWDFGDGQSYSVHEPNSVIEQPYNVTHEFDYEGSYNVTVKAHNAVDNKTANVEITVLYPVQTGWTVDSNSPQLLPPGEVNFTLSLPSSVELPSMATAVFTWDSVTNKEQSTTIDIPMVEFSPDLAIPLAHTYKRGGQYEVSVFISNAVSNITITTNVTVTERIEGLSVQMRYTSAQDGGSGPKEAGGPDKNTVATNCNVSLHVTALKGTITGYSLYTWSGEWIQNSSTSPIYYYVTQAGTYNLTVYGWNDVQGPSEGFNFSIKSMSIISGLEINDFYLSTGENETKTFEVVLSSLTADDCVLVSYNDSRLVNPLGEEIIHHAYGSMDTCRGNYSEYDLWYEGPASNPMNVSRVFRSKGVYVINVVVFNQLNVANSSLVFTVTNFPCPKPEISLEDERTTVATAAPHQMSVGVRIAAEAVLDCANNITTKKQWLVYLVDSKFGLEVNEINISDIESSTKSILCLPPLLLPYGHYKLVYMLSIVAEGMDPRYPWTRSLYTYIQIVPTDLLAILVPGSMSYVLRGLGQTLQLDPQNNSLDPDAPEDNNFNVTWLCRRVKPTNESFSTDSNGDYDLGRQLSVPGVNDSKPGSDGGGCFGTGAGPLSLRNGSWSVNTAVFYAASMTYEVLVVVSKDTRKAEANIHIEVADGNPPSVLIECQNHLICHPLSKGLLINPSSRLGFYGSCLDGCDQPLSYKWNLFDVDTHAPVTEADDYMIGQDEHEMAINSGFFGNVSGPDAFHLQLEIRSALGVVGRSLLYLYVNRPPTAGTCTMTPTTGRVLLDTFRLLCTDWIDPENHPIESYTFFTQKSDSVDIFVLASSNFNHKDVVLPYGELNLRVTIEDVMGATVTVDIAVLSLSLPSVDEYNAYLNSSEMSNLVGGGQQETICQVMQAISSIKASGLLEPPTPKVIDINGTNVTDKSAQDQQQIQDANIINGQLDMLFTLTSSGSLKDLELVASTLKSVVGSGVDVDATSKQKAVDMMQHLGNHLLGGIESASPQQLRKAMADFTSIFGGINKAIADVALRNETLPSDVLKVNDLDYDSSVDTEDDASMPLTMEDMHKYAIKADTIYKSKKQSAAIEDVFRGLGDKIISQLVANEPSINVDINGAATMFGKLMGSNASQLSVPMSDSLFTLPDFCELMNQENCNESMVVGIKAMLLPAPLQTYGRDIDRLSINTKTIQIEIYDENLKLIPIKNMSKPVDIYIPRTTTKDPIQLPEPTYINATLKWNELMMYHQFVIDKPASSVNIELTPDDLQANFLLFVRFDKKPTITKYDLVIPLSKVPLLNGSSGTCDWFISSLDVANRTGLFYLGVAELKAEFGGMDNLTYRDMARNFTSRYSIRIFTSGCYFYNERLNRWSGDGCQVANANYSMTHCRCNHLTSFGSGFFVSPNTVDFDYVFAHASFNDNLTIYMTIIVTLAVCIFILIYARWQDRKDLKKLGAAPLPDNVATDKYLYEILIFTGSHSSAGTDSKVYFILSGDDDETEVRHFADDQRKIFQRGEVDVFIMSVPRCLGSLNYMRMWHDNSGVSNRASWYLNYAVVRDVQTGDKFEFIANCWFALEEGEGCIDRLLPVAGREQKTEFGHLISNTSQREIADGHLWFSIFLRPPRSRFTRVQRVGCCVAFLYLSMLVNAMWYGTVSTGPNTSAFKLGPFSISTEQIGVGIVSNLIVFPPSFLIVLLFRKSRPRKLRRSRIQEALHRQSVKTSESKQDLTKHDVLDQQHQMTSGVAGKWQRKRRCTLPWFFQLVAWLLVVVCIGASVFFLWSYGISFGNDKTKKWVTSLVVSFFASVLITEPLKLFLMAMLLSAICKATDMDSDDADEDEEDPALLADEDYLHNAPVRERRKRYFPPDPQALSNARERRLKEIQMWAVLREIIGYFLFLWVLVVMSYGNRDPNAYYFKRTLHRSFVRPGLSNDFNNVHNTQQFWKWSSKVLVPRLRAQRMYNNVPPFGFKGFLQDQVNRMLGYAIMRQIRMKPGLCDVPHVMHNVSGDCSGSYTLMVDEDEHNYGLGWNQSAMVNEEDMTDLHRAFRHQKASELDGYPSVGDVDVYGGGGYVLPLKGRQSDVLHLLQQLQELNWIDRYTRSVNVEFSIFNAQVNLFGVCSMKVEMIPGGGFFPSSRFDGIRLLEYHTGFGLVVMLAEILFVLFTIYFTVKEVIEVCRLKRKWLNSYWNYAEALIIALSLSTVVVYAFRYIHTQHMLQRFNDTKGNAYINLQYVYTLDQLFAALVALVVFLATLKFIKLLRFNRRMGILSSTLAYAWGELTVFGLGFLVVFLAFVQLFYLIMSPNSSDFSTFVRTVEYTFSMMLQKFDFSVIEDSCPFYGPVAFFFFSLMTTIVLVNLLLTIIIRAFEEVSRDIFKQPNDYEIVDFIVGRFTAFIGLGTTAAAPSNTRQQLFRTNDDQHNGGGQVEQLSDRVDRLANKVNRVYFDGKIKWNQGVSQSTRGIVCSTN